MTAPVEARSLSSLTTLFANPPQYPRNPTHKDLEPLVLYIVRVPGSDDVFLTPLKPPTKASIGAEAIRTCLYYFHVTTPEDEIVKSSFEERRNLRVAEHGETSEVIHRKPLPSAPFLVASASEPLQSHSKSSIQLRRRSSEQANENLSTEHGEDSNHPQPRLQDGHIAISRKPIGARPLATKLKTSDSAMTESKPVGGSGLGGNVRQRARTDLQPQVPGMHLTEDEQLTNNVDEARTGRSLNTMPHDLANVACDQLSPAPPLPPPPSLPERPTEKDLRITIIRRDPTSGGQWNTGILSRNHPAGPGHPDSLRIEITAPGYQRFTKKLDSRTGDLQTAEPTTTERAGDRIPGYLSTTTERHGFMPMAPTPAPAHFVPIPFTRDMNLTRPSPSHRLKQPHGHARSSSSESFSFPLSHITAPTQPSATPYLSFSSPWQGICTFTTAMDGRSLRCRHELPPGNREQSQRSVLAAELRFNLPWSALKSRDTNARAPAGARRPNSLALLGEDTRHSFKRGMARVRQELASTSSDTDIRTGVSTPAAHQTSLSTPDALQTSRSPSVTHEDSDSSSSGRLDLKLGRERAGGGRKGKSAKLGKLVLRDEGLKMADLVVAACMGVWWDVYCGRGDARV